MATQQSKAITVTEQCPCGKPILRAGGKRGPKPKWCSRGCSNRSGAKRRYKRKLPPKTPCAWCGGPKAIRYQRCCSNRCGQAWRRAQPGFTEAARQAQQRRPGIVTTAECLFCGREFVYELKVGQKPKQFDTERCRLRYKSDALNRLRRGVVAEGEDIKRGEVFQRDGWKCWLCGKECDRLAVLPDPDAPTLDHVIPIAKGGRHTMGNVRCACYRCNCKKGSKIVSPPPGGG